MPTTIMQANAFVTSFKTKAKADEIAATMAGDPDFTTKVVERQDGRFVVVLIDKETGEENVL